MVDLDEIGIVLQNLLDQYTPPVNLYVLLRGYRIHKGMEVPWKDYGYSDPVTFLRENFPNQLTVHESPDHKGVHLVTLKTEPQQVTERMINGFAGASNYTGSGAGSASVVSWTSSPSVPKNSSCSDIFRPNTLTKTYTSTKAVPAKFRTFLGRLMKNYPTGISAKDFVETFFTKYGAPLNYTMYGYPGHLSMFRDLDDVFRLETGPNGEHTLYPINNFGRSTDGSRGPEITATASVGAHRSGTDVCIPPKDVQKQSQASNSLTLRDNFNNNGAGRSSTDQATLAGTSLYLNDVASKSAQMANTSRLSKSITFTSAQSTPNSMIAKRNSTRSSQQQMTESCSSAVSKETTQFGDLFIVELNNNLYVPTACLAALVGMISDHVLEDLTECGLDLQDVKFLSARVPEHKLLRLELARIDCPFIINPDGSIANVIALVPIGLCSTILRALPEVPKKLSTEEPNANSLS